MTRSSTRLVQLIRKTERRIALVREPQLILLENFTTVYSLALSASVPGSSMSELVQQNLAREALDYDAVYAGQSPWTLFVPIDHPEPSRCLVSGTGLTHLGSAKNRQSMHGAAESALTDSMRMFRWGVEGGRPAAGKIGMAPEWFYKGCGSILRSPGQALTVPAYAEDGGEEAEIAGIYIIDEAGCPRRIGMATGNEFSDHKFEKRNYLNLAGSKIRTCSLGPELVIDPSFDNVTGTVAIERGGAVCWSKEIATGEAEMCHSLANIEHHHFKFESHRRAGDLHVHFFGAHSLSFGDGVQLIDGDMMTIKFTGFGRPLRNPIKIEPPMEKPMAVKSLL